MSRYTESIGYIIHQRKFKDNSLILEFFSKDYGKIQLIAKGIKKNKQLVSQVQYFTQLKVQFFGKSHLKTLSSINILQINDFPDIVEKTAGLYLNELLYYCLLENEQSKSLYTIYESTLEQLGKEKLTTLLRLFEKEILKTSGFGLSIDGLKEPDVWVDFDNTLGLIEAKNDIQKICKMSDLTNFMQGLDLNQSSQIRLNKLMLKAIDMCVSHKRLYSRELLKSLFSK